MMKFPCYLKIRLLIAQKLETQWTRFKFLLKWKVSTTQNSNSMKVTWKRTMKAKNTSLTKLNLSIQNMELKSWQMNFLSTPENFLMRILKKRTRSLWNRCSQSSILNESSLMILMKTKRLHPEVHNKSTQTKSKKLQRIKQMFCIRMESHSKMKKKKLTMNRTLKFKADTNIQSIEGLIEPLPISSPTNPICLSSGLKGINNKIRNQKNRSTPSGQKVQRRILILRDPRSVQSHLLKFLKTTQIWLKRIKVLLSEVNLK